MSEDPPQKRGTVRPGDLATFIQCDTLEPRFYYQLSTSSWEKFEIPNPPPVVLVLKTGVPGTLDAYPFARILTPDGILHIEEVLLEPVSEQRRRRRVVSK